MTEQDVFNLYDKLNLWKNSTCESCKNSSTTALSGPVSVWQVGKEYANDGYRLLFVEKNIQRLICDDRTKELEQHSYIDGTSVADKWIRDMWSPYWSYMTLILKGLYGTPYEAWERVCYTSLIKCNNKIAGDTTPEDTTTREMATNCLDNIGVVWKEIELLRPRTIIFIMGRDYDSFIERYTSQFECTDVTNERYFILNEGRLMRWWDRRCRDSAGNKFRMLRVSSPEFQSKESYVAKIVNWINGVAPNSTGYSGQARG